MEKSKYYTPEIEEFCVGFECEFKSYDKNNKEQWDKRVIGIHSFQESSYEQIDYKSNWRVKYLDEKDILSLGFNLHYKPHNVKFYFKNQDEKIGITLRKYFYNDGFCNVHIYELREPILTLFSGKIRNKTELIKLLSQLDN